MDHQDQEESPVIHTTQERAPQSPEACGPTTESQELSGYAHTPIRTLEVPEPNSGNSTNSDPTALLASTAISPPKLSVAYKGTSSGGWQSGCVMFSIIVGTVFLVNLLFTVLALVYEYDYEEGLGTVYSGKCMKVQWWNSVAHVIINVVGTILLGASNYTMQCLSSPNREEIDAAHKVNKELDIGIPSIRNLYRVSRRRAVMWCLLAMSSIPLHFLYNGVVFSTITSYEYSVWIAGENYLPEDVQYLERLEWKECLEGYGKNIMNDRKDLLILIPGYEAPRLLVRLNHTAGGSAESQGFEWICESHDNHLKSFCDIKTLTQADSWRVGGANVQYCLSQPMGEKCSLHYSAPIMVAVLICNAVKFICVILAFLEGRGENKLERLVTIGDAIVSFLTYPDKTTTGITVHIIEDGSYEHIDGETLRFRVPDRSRWYHAVGFRRWFICYFLYIVAIGSAITFLVNGYVKLGSDISASFSQEMSFIWSLGIGTADTRLAVKPLTFIPFKYRFLACIIIANLPQAILTFLYLVYNSIFTCMLLGKEWDDLSRRFRPLRVTSPERSVSNEISTSRLRWALSPLIDFFRGLRPSRPIDEQGSTYFLQLAYRYSVPLMVVSGLLHWLISQSLFATRFMNVYSSKECLWSQPGDERLSSPLLIWSPVGTFFSIILSTLVLLAAVISGFQKYRGNIPSVGSSSAAIRVLCQPLEAVDVTRRLKWGVVSTGDDGVGYCSLSNREDITLPASGKVYISENLLKERIMESGEL